MDNLRRSIEYSCPKCSIKFCQACGERVDPAKAEKPGYDPLLHCPDLQGVILGMGLAMLEHLYNQEAVVDESKSTKKRKSTPLSATPSAGTEDDDDDYQPNPRGGKKAKGGTGYAGNAKEDVRSASSFSITDTDSNPPHLSSLAKLKRSEHSTSATNSWAPCYRK